jgi:hypothetical protein
MTDEEQNLILLINNNYLNECIFLLMICNKINTFQMQFTMFRFNKICDI